MLTTTTNSEYLVYFMSILSISFWLIIWMMHVCALTNAKLKLNKRSYTSAGSKKKRKLENLKKKIVSTILKTGNIREPNQKLDIICRDYNNSILSNYTPIVDQQQNIFGGLPEKDFSVSPAAKTNNANANLRTNHPPIQDKQLLLPTTITSTQPKPPPLASPEIGQKTQSPPYSPPPPPSPLTPQIAVHQIPIPMQTTQEQILASRYDKDDILHQKIINHIISNYYINLPLPGVSIIKPLVGVDANLHTNLETFFQMDYPTYELLFCIQDPDDAAILIVKNLMKIYPNIDARLFIGGSRVGVNPKINNMQPAYESMKYELVLISDSGISMKKDTLLDMVGHMRQNVALVHQMPFVCDGREGFQSVFEKVYFGTAHARAYLTADLLNINCPTGMSALMRKNLIDEVGGIKAFGQYLAEDFFFAKSFTDRGWKISISSQPAWQNSANESDTLSTLNSRIQRWVKLRFAMVPHWTLIEPFSECMLSGLLGAMSISYLWPLDPLAIFLFHVLLWFLFDYKLLCTVQNGPLTFSKTDFVIAWLIRECTALLIFLKALSDPKVTWRSRQFKLKWGGYAEEVVIH